MKSFKGENQNMRKTSIFVLLMTLFIIFSSFCVQAETRTVLYSGTYDGRDADADWFLYSDGELLITGEGCITDATFNGSNDVSTKYPWYKHRTSVKKITVGEGITVVGAYIFASTNATSISLPSTLTQIGSYAFYNSDKLTGFELPATIKLIGTGAFSNCQILASIYVPYGASISTEAFMSCPNLKTAIISSAGYQSFRYCNSLHTVTILNPTMTVDKWAFANCSNVTTFYFAGTEAQWNTLKETALSNLNGAAFNNSTVKYVRTLSFDANGGGYAIPPVVAEINASGDTVTTITSTIPTRKGYTFYGWGDYKFDTIVKYNAGDTYTLSANSTVYAIWETPEGVVAKGTNSNTDMTWTIYEDGTMTVEGTGLCCLDDYKNDYGYRHYQSYIKDVIIKEGITAVSNTAFSKIAIRSVSLPSTIEWIGNHAFSYNGYLKEITIPDNVTLIGTGAILATNIETVNLGNPKADISSIFTGCADLYELNKITVNENNEIFTVENGVLYDKAKTTVYRVPATFSGQFVLPDTVTTISKFAFANTNIESIVFPTSVKTIGESVFYGCTIKTAYYKGTEEEWKKISISNDNHNLGLTYAKKEYEYGKAYSIKYNANGGSGAPENAEKIKGEDFAISSIIPTKPGSTFKGWSTNKNATTAEYQPNDIYTQNCDTEFFAVWELKDSTVSAITIGSYMLFNISIEDDISDCTAYAAFYNGNQLISCDFNAIVNKTAQIILPKDTNATEAKVFVWDNTNNNPYTKAYPITLK